MADNETTIGVAITGDSSGFVKATKEVETSAKAATDAIEKIGNQVDVLINHFNSLKNVDFSKLASNLNDVKVPNVSIGSGQSFISGKSTAMVYDTTNQSDVERANQIVKEIQKEQEAQVGLLKEQTEKIKNVNNNYDKILENETKRANAKITEADAKSQIAAFKSSDANLSNLSANTARHLLLQPYYRFKGKHPELFTTAGLTKSKNYQAGNVFQNLGNSIKTNSLSGYVANTSLNVIGSALKIGKFGAISTAVSAIGQGLIKLGEAATKAYGEIDSLKTQLSVVFGSDIQSTNAFSEISEYAVNSPFGVSQTTELAILLKQSGVEATNLMDTLKMLGDTAGGNMEKMKRIANNYAQIVSIGKASMLDMRQFAYAGIPIFEAVSDELGVSQTRLRKMISDGEITAEIVEKVFKDLTGINGIFENATEKGAKTYKARKQNLEDTKQLALAGMGEQIISLGEKYGGDSIAMNVMGIQEDFYDKLNKLTTFQNIENSVKVIEKRNSRITELKELIEYAKSTGNKDAQTTLEKEMNRLLSLKDFEKERSILASSYEQTNNSYLDYIKNNPEAEFYTLEEIFSKLYNLKKELEIFSSKNDRELTDEIWNTLHNPSDSQKTYNEFEKDYKMLANQYTTLQTEYDAFSWFAKKADTALADSPGKSAYEIKQNELVQQTESDRISKLNKSSNSVVNDRSTIQGYIESSEEYKQKKQEEEIDRLKKSQELLKQIAENTEPDSNVLSFAKVSAKQLSEWVDKGAVEGRGLALTADRDTKGTDWLTLRNQLTTRVRQTRDSFMEDGKFTSEERKARDILSKININRLNGYDNKEDFYNDFNTNYKEAYREIEFYFNKAGDDLKPFWKNILDGLKQSVIKYSVDTEGMDVDIDSLFDKSKKEKEADTFVPLWKRILSSSTGVATSAITGTKQTLDFYHENLSTRSTAGNLLSAMAKEGMGIDKIRNLVASTGSSVQLKGDTGNTYQIDWVKTRKNLELFATKLSASTTAIDAWTKGLEDEYDTYANLIGSGILTAESDGIKQAKTISADKLNKEWLSADSQGVNAFGEKLVTELDEEVVKIVDGVAYTRNQNGKLVRCMNQNVVTTGKIYDEIKKRRLEIERELKKAKIAQAENKVLSTMQNSSISGILAGQAMGGKGYKFTNFVTNFGDEYQAMLEANLKGMYGKGTEYNTLADLFTAYLNKEKDAIDKINTALSLTYFDVDNFTNTPAYQNGFAAYQNKDNQARVNSDYNTLQGIRENKNSTWKETWAENNRNWYESDVMSNLGLSSSFDEMFSQANKKYQDTYQELQVLENRKELNETEKERIKLLKEQLQLTTEISEEDFRHELASESIEKALQDMAKEFQSIVKETAKDAWLQPFKTLGEDVIDLANGSKQASDYWKDLGNSMSQIAGQMLSQMGTAMATAGFNIAASCALDKNWAGVALGLGLAAAGGFASGFGSSLTKAQEDEDSTQAEIEKLQTLKDDLADLLEQARTDALYYEQNLRHKTALGANEKFSYKSVNDAIITPDGVISTHPDDYIIATKTPETLGARSANVKINNIVNNNAGVQVSQESRTNNDGSIDIITTLENAMAGYISSSRSDDAFNARQARVNGTSYVG